MRKLRYKLTSGTDELLSGETTYIVKNNFITFEIDKILIKLNPIEKIFIRETVDDKFEVIKRKDTYIGKFTLVNPPCIVDIDIQNFELKRAKNSIELTYEIVGDDSGLKSLKIFF